MPLETIFSACQGLAMLGWLALALAPLSRHRLVWTARGVAALLALAYLTQMFTIVEPSGGSFTSLAGITALFSKPGNVMLGWTHYLAFDLFVGSWEIEDAGKQGLPHWLMLIMLFLTLMIGPVGLLTYLAIRTIHIARMKKDVA
ncbi:MAG: hypothetical protein RL367_2771 [Pseudomonadota bacterium]|jgi:hypothetical protein